MAPITRLYGRHLSDFERGQSYAHPWEVTVDGGMVALFQAAFLDACPVFASAPYARALGFAERPLHPMLLLNLVLSFSVHDVSEQCIAHLSYLRVDFPRAVYAGATLHAASTCLDLSRSDGERGVVHVRTVLFDEREQPVCSLERKALLRAGHLRERPRDPYTEPAAVPSQVDALPPELSTLPAPPLRSFGFAGFLEDFAPGDVLCHQVGKTVSEAEHFMLTSLVRNTHPLHSDAHYAASGGSFSARPVVMGGLVFAWTMALSSRDLAGNALWELGFSEGAHSAPVHAGDSLYAATQVLAVEPIDAHYGKLVLRQVAVKNQQPERLLERGDALFSSEQGKAKNERIPEKVFEITRTVLVRRAPV